MLISIEYNGHQEPWLIQHCLPTAYSALSACRYDVLLKADQPPSAYWLSAVVVNGTRTGSPAGYGVLRYAGVNSSELPTQPLLQPETVKPWPLTFYRQVLEMSCAPTAPCAADP